jgi:hypothetical protein
LKIIVDKTSKIVFFTLCVLIVGAIVFSYDRTIVRRDFILFPDESIEEELDMSESEEVAIPGETFLEPISSTSEPDTSVQ